MNVSLYARAPDKTELVYVGGIKFARQGTPVQFDSEDQAREVGRQLCDRFPVLKKYKLYPK